MPKIFLHLGAQKTGSKTLQKSFYESRAKLAKSGIAYLGRPSYYDGLYSAFAPSPETWTGNIKRGLTMEQIMQERQATLSRIEQEIKASNCKSIILSAENLFRLPDEDMAGMRDFFARFGEVHAVYYYRHLTTWRASYSQQLARGGSGREIASFSDALVPIVTAPRRIIRVFGAERSHLVSFEAAVKQGLCRNFLSICAEPGTTPPEVEEIVSNSGMSEYAAWALFAYNGYIRESGKPRDLRVYRKLHSLPGPKLRTPTLTSAEHAEYTRHYNDLTAELGLQLEHPDDIPISEDPPAMMIPAEALVTVFADYQTAATRAAIAAENAKKKPPKPVAAEAGSAAARASPAAKPAAPDATPGKKTAAKPAAVAKPAASAKPALAAKPAPAARPADVKAAAKPAAAPKPARNKPAPGKATSGGKVRAS